jgi:predicted patatin/cPLA2 family phospholipase
MFGLGKKKKKKKKTAREIQRFNEFLQSLQSRSPTTAAGGVWGTILSRLLQSYGKKAQESIQAQAMPTWQEAQKRAEILQQTGALGEYGNLAKYFSERFGKWLTQKTGEAVEKAQPDIISQWQTIYETLTKPEFGTVYGLATKGQEQFGASPVAEIRQTIQDAVKSYQDALKSIEEFLKAYDIIDISPSDIIKSIWG